MMKLHNDAYKLLIQLPGRHAHLEAVRWLKDINSFYKKTADGVLEFVRPDWLGPEPTIILLSQVPDDLIGAYEVCLADELLEIVSIEGGDYALSLTQKGRAVLAEDKPAKEKQPRSKKGQVNKHMAEMIQADPALIDWPATKWATKLGVSTTAVKLSHTWTEIIMPGRSLHKAERASRVR